MGRRTFLKLASVALAATAGRLAFHDGRSRGSGRPCAGSLYRAGGGGKILTSADGGTSWGLHSALRDISSIANLGVDRRSGSLRLTVEYEGSTFPLVFGPDKRAWLTV